MSEDPRAPRFGKIAFYNRLAEQRLREGKVILQVTSDGIHRRRLVRIVASSEKHFSQFCREHDIKRTDAIYVEGIDSLRGILGVVVVLDGCDLRADWYDFYQEMLAYVRPGGIELWNEERYLKDRYPKTHIGIDWAAVDELHE